MRVDIHLFGGGEKSLEAFADAHALTMIVRERGEHSSRYGKRFYAHFDGVEVMDRGMLVTDTGNGDTPEEAIEDYLGRLRGKRIAIRAYRPERVEVDVPNELGKP